MTWLRLLGPNVVGLLWSCTAGAQALPANVAAALEQAGIPASSVGIYVRDPADSEALVAYQSSRAMIPASVMKLVTAFAALELLGPAYTWKSEVYGTRVGGEIVEGDLYIKGYGDPKLTLEDFWLLLRELRAHGVREIRGDLVLDNSYFETPQSAPSDFDNQGFRAYNVLPQALMVAFKAVNFRFFPEPEHGRVRVIAEPDLPQVDLVNRMELKVGACPSDWRAGLQELVSGSAVAAHVTFSGPFYADCRGESLSLSVLGNTEFIYALFTQLWTELGGRFAGTAREGAIGRDASLLVTHDSHPLADAVRDMNKFSNNLMARQLLLTLGAQFGGAPGTTRKGAEVIRKWLAGKNLSFPELVIDNGSGLSRVERISPRHIGELLVLGARSPVMPELVASLPVVALDGTLKRRLNGGAIAGQAHLKTGSLDGVKTIAGYVLDRAGRQVVVVLFVNDPRAWTTEQAQDALLEWVYNRK
jgi:serine-type D-Ala-D-Ala carboxypeptidase/endopeptidase (penicillin-binding protein 4)